jgi:hypothetical protein
MEGLPSVPEMEGKEKKMRAGAEESGGLKTLVTVWKKRRGKLSWASGPDEVMDCLSLRLFELRLLRFS